MTKRFLVYSNDANFGVFEAEDEQGAIDACAREAGYESERDMVQQLEQASTLIAKMVNPVPTWVIEVRDEDGTLLGCI
jgi:Uma2 family endonuclease